METKELIEQVLNEDQTLGRKETKFAWGAVIVDAPWYVDKTNGYVAVMVRLSFLHSFNSNDTGLAGEHTLDSKVFTWNERASKTVGFSKAVTVASQEEGMAKAKAWGTKAFAKWSQ